MTTIDLPSVEAKRDQLSDRAYGMTGEPLPTRVEMEAFLFSIRLLPIGPWQTYQDLTESRLGSDEACAEADETLYCLEWLLKAVKSQRDELLWSFVLFIILEHSAHILDDLRRVDQRDLAEESA